MQENKSVRFNTGSVYVVLDSELPSVTVETGLPGTADACVVQTTELPVTSCVRPESTFFPVVARVCKKPQKRGPIVG